MPHSSGGGSHGGGFHGGSGGSGGGPSHRVGNTYFPGARRYVYYDRRRHIPRYYYTNYDVSTVNPVKTMITTLAITIPLLLLMVFAFVTADEPPSPIYDNCRYNSEIYDYADVIDNEREVLSAVNEFTAVSGIKVAIVTVNNETWYSDGWFSGSKSSQLEDYAYNLYVDMFGGDEYHWLIVYSEPTNPDSNFNDWHWEGMQGDDTDSVLTEAKADIFNKTFNDYLLKKDVGDAFADAFGYFSNVIMTVTEEELVESYLIYGLITAIIIGVILFEVVLNKNWKLSKASEFRANDKKIKCEYCSGEYVSGTVMKCPYCGAPVSLETEE
ncbi:MAG: TPM domain-containing protein [Lachnospiraceae bacterium]|nr:TPM domain-containing protein [Lachnospiraceae bacterium]